MPLRFAHVSDIHLLDLAGIGLWRYANKRLTGGVNLALRRGRKHDGVLFDRILTRLGELRVDRLVVTGDVTNLSLEPEFELVRHKLAGAGVPVTVIPGNHDTYTRGSVRARRFESFLRGFMEGERESEHDYPFLQRFDDVALVGVSSAVATLPLWATGRVGDSQLERLARALRVLRGEGRARVVLVHHPPVAGISRARHGLDDLAAFSAVVAAEGAELVLHGHEHQVLVSRLAGPVTAVPVHGIGSGTSASADPRRAATFSVYDVEAAGIRHELYRWDGSDFVAAGTHLPAPTAGS